MTLKIGDRHCLEVHQLHFKLNAFDTIPMVTLFYRVFVPNQNHTQNVPTSPTLSVHANVCIFKIIGARYLQNCRQAKEKLRLLLAQCKCGSWPKETPINIRQTSRQLVSMKVVTYGCFLHIHRQSTIALPSNTFV